MCFLYLKSFTSPNLWLNFREMWVFCSLTSFSVRPLFVQTKTVFYLYLCIWIAYAECQWLDGLSSPSEFISSIKLSNYLFMSWGQDMYAHIWKHAQQCHLALESRGWVGGETVFLMSPSAFMHFMFMINLLLSQHYFVFSFNLWPNFHILHLAVVLENMLYAIQSHYTWGFLTIGVILIISFLYKTGNHNSLLWKF